MEFLKKILHYLRNYKVRCNLLGGEPGLIKNLDEVITEIKSNPNHVCEVLSNSMVRRRWPQVLKDSDIIYVEHLVLDFYEHEITKLGNYDFHDVNDMNNFNLVIETPNFKKYKHLYPKVIKKLDHKNTLWKEFNGRSPGFLDVIQADEIDRKMCAAFPMVPVIDFEKQHIVHCSKKFANNAILSKNFELTQENIDKMMNFRLFKYENYCKTCTEYVQPKGHFNIKKYASILNE
jgi:organic radical activating enzyme